MVCKRLFAKRLHLSRQKTSLQMHHWVTHYKCSVSNFYKSLTKRDILESEWFFRTMYIIVTFYFSVEMLNSWWHCNLSFFIWQADWSIEFQFSKPNKHHTGLTIFIYLIFFFFNIPSMYYIHMILNDLLNLYEIAVGRTKRAEIVKSPTFLKRGLFQKNWEFGAQPILRSIKLRQSFSSSHLIDFVASSPDVASLLLLTRLIVAWIPKYLSFFPSPGILRLTFLSKTFQCKGQPVWLLIVYLLFLWRHRCTFFNCPFVHLNAILKRF